LKAQLDDLQNRLRLQQEDGILRGAEGKAALAELAKKLAALEGLPAQVKTAGDDAKLSWERSTALEQRSRLQLQARLEGQRDALQAVLSGLALSGKALRGPGPLAGLDLALDQFLEATALTSQPGFNALVATVKDKLSKGPLGNPLREPAVMNAYFANPVLGSNWLVAAVPFGPGWDSDKLKTLEKGLGAVDVATRMDLEAKTARILVAALKGEAAQLQTMVDEQLLATQGLLDPAASGSAAVDGELLASKAEAAFKPLLEAATHSGLTPADRDGLVALLGARTDLQGLMLEQRHLLGRMLGLADGVTVTFTRFRLDEPGRSLPALENLLKAAGETKGRLKAALAPHGPEGKALARLEAAGYPVKAAAQ
jgi:hypothetical protein